MTLPGPDAILSAFVIFCRVGACLMLMPGFSSPRVPVQVRLYVAIAITLALTPLLLTEVSAAVKAASPITVLRLAASETMTGALIGLIGRFFFLALETMATSATMAVGLGNNLGAPVDENEPAPPLVTLITLGATVLLFVTDQHWEIFRGLAASYSALPVEGGFRARLDLAELADGASKAFFLALRISSPFIVFAIIVNLALGLANKLTPQIPIYFISLPFVIAAGLLLFFVTIKQFLDLFIAAFATWLSAG